MTRVYTGSMPDRAILAYYDAIAPKILPFLRGRPIAVRAHFENAVVFRRHPGIGRVAGNKKQWLRVETKNDLLALVHQHGYEFFSHLEGDKDVWFALDVDMREIPLPLGKRVVRTALDILDERHMKYLLSYSGGNGFHIRWAFPTTGLPRGKWTFLRRIVRALQQETERRLQTASDRSAFYEHLPNSDPITEWSSADKVAQHSVLFDELILKPLATIRAPFSMHMKRQLVAVPIDPKHLAAFEPERDATPEAAIAAAVARVPKNPVAPFLTSPWI